MNTFYLKVKEFDGEHQLIVDGLTNKYDLDSTIQPELIAHDLIEHDNGIGEMGDLNNEIAAVLMAFYGRGAFGAYFLNEELKTPPLEIFYNDLSSLEEYFKDSHVISEEQLEEATALIKVSPLEGEIEAVLKLFKNNDADFYNYCFYWMTKASFEIDKRHEYPHVLNGHFFHLVSDLQYKMDCLYLQAIQEYSKVIRIDLDNKKYEHKVTIIDF